MTRTPPTMSELKERALKALEQGRNDMKDESFIPTIHCGDAMDGEGDMLVACAGDVMNSEAAKEALAQKVKAEIEKHGYTYAIFVSDTRRLQITGDKAKAGLAMTFMRRGVPLAMIAKAGLGTLEEALMVTIGGLGCGTSMVSQTYTRANGIEDGPITSFDEPRFSESEGETQMTGRFCFF